MAAVKVDRTRTKPKVGIIGEFWAMTTEGDGNYGLQRFLESEGAEVEVQLVTAWLLYMLWQASTTRTSAPSCAAPTRAVSRARNSASRAWTCASAWSPWRRPTKHLVRYLFQTTASRPGPARLPPARHGGEVAEVSHAFYDNNLRGGEGHMEVGKLIQNIVHNKVNMTLSVKPFGCMPSSSVSDGVQSLISEMYPQGIFLPIETNGDGAVNVYSRVQMQLFKAKQLAAKEVQKALETTGQTMEEVQAYLAKHPKLSSAFHRSPHAAGCTTADLVHEVAAHRDRFSFIKNKVFGVFTRGSVRKAATTRIVEIAKIAAAKARAKKDAKAAVLDEQETAAAVLDETRPAIPAGRKALRVLN